MESFLFALLAAFIAGFAPFLEKLGLSSVEPTAAYLIRCSAIILGAIIVITFTPSLVSMEKMETKSIFFLFLSGFLTGFVGQLVFYKALKLGEVSRIIPITSCYPLFTFIFSWIFLGEAITLYKVLGMLLILMGILLLRF
jgi:transporter family protein